MQYRCGTQIQGELHMKTSVNKKITLCLVVIAVMFPFVISTMGCTDDESPYITITFKSSYHYDAMGQIIVDGTIMGLDPKSIFTANGGSTFLVEHYTEHTYKIKKSQLPDKKYHTITFSAGSGGEEKSATCDKVTERVTFEVVGSVPYGLSFDSVKCVSYS